MNTPTRAALLGGLGLGAALHAGTAQTTRAIPAPAPSPVFSIGQPPRWQPYAGGLAFSSLGGDGGAATLVLGVRRSLLDPVTGLAAIAGEAYGAAGRAFGGGGARVLLSAPMLALGTGIDWNLGANGRGRADWIVSYQSAIRRGGLFGHGTMLRVDWLPTRGKSLGVGLSVPLMQPLAGRTRPRAVAVQLSRSSAGEALDPNAFVPSGVDQALRQTEDAALALAAYTNTWANTAERRVSGGPSYESAVRQYLSGLARAFGLASGNAGAGADIAARARTGLLHEVLVPYDSLFGRPKENARSIRELTSAAQAQFATWLRDSCRVPGASRAAVEAAHARWLRAIERVHAQILAEAGDSRLAWLPLRLALAPEQYDDQSEVDALLGKLAGGTFTDQNALSYLRSIDLPLEIARSIYAARDYHVLWTHDFAGTNDGGTLDNVAYEMVADAYLPALTAAVRRYDVVGALPVYMICIDQYFYEPRNGRLWMTILENPLGASMRLPHGNASREAHLRARQAELRAAVASSARLRRDAARTGGDAWIRRMVKVHVNVMQPSDFSFRSGRIVPPLPFAPDNLMRDHRKIVLYDLNEADPYRGGVILTGIGIGEHYSSGTWEDRGYRLRGPAALETRVALRRVLLRNGYRPEDIPPPLRELRDVRHTERRMNLGDYVGRALQVHNDVGFGAKSSSVVRAALYDLAAPGSVVVVPDPLWLSRIWAGMLAGAAVRGARVHVIAPAASNAPSPQAPLLALSHDVLVRVLELRQHLATRLRESGGELRVGLFAARAPADDAEGRRREVREGLARAPWIRALIPFDAATLAVLDRAQTRAATDGEDATDIARDAKPRLPQLHQKTQFVARPGAIAALVRQPGWDEVLARAMEAQSRQTARFAEQLGWQTPDAETEATRATDAMLRGYERALPASERERVSFYFSLGTQNQDPRGLVSDGEATLVTSGFQGATGLVDLYFLMARSSWVTTRAELEQDLPAPRGLVRRLAHLLRLTL